MRKRKQTAVLVIVICLLLLPAAAFADGEAGGIELSLSNHQSSGKPVLMWQNEGQIALFDIYRSNDPDKGFEYLDSVFTHSYRDTAAEAGQTYYYKVQAYNDSSVVSPAVGTVCKCAMISDIVVDYADNGSIVFSWSRVEGATGYKVLRSDSENGSYSVISGNAVLSEPVFSDMSARAGSYYYYRLVAVNYRSSDADSAPVDGPALPLYPTVKNVKDASTSRQNVITWDKISGVDGYVILRGAAQDIEQMEPLAGVVQPLLKNTVTYKDDGRITGVYYAIVGVKDMGEDNDPIPTVPAFIYVGSSPCSHSFTKTVTAPTCTQPGYTAHTCTKCGYSYKDEYVGVTDHDLSTVVTVAAPTCTEKGTEALCCSRCGAYELRELPKASHDFGVWSAQVEATCTEAGTDIRFCSRCDAIETRGVKALGHDYANGKCTRCGAADPDYKISAPKISVAKATSGKPTVSWSAVDGAVKYKVYRATSQSGTYSLMLTTTKLSYTNTSAKAGTTYYYRVKAVSASDKTSSYSNTVSLKATLGKPTVTVSVVASSGKIKLSWPAIDGATKYEVYRATSKTGTYSKMITTSSTSYTNTSAKVGTTYYYKVRAINGTTAANSSYSEIKYATCDCAQPVVTLSTVASSGKIKLTWKAVEGATKYEVYRATSKTGTYTKLLTTTKTTYTNTSAKAGTTYYYKVRAIASKSAANSAYSAIKSMTCDLAQPTVKITTSNGDPKLSWDKVTGATKYEVWRATSKSGTYTKMTTTTKNTYTNTSAKAGTTYYYKVRAICGVSAATSAYSTVVSIKAK